jgi:hypothetical protein
MDHFHKLSPNASPFIINLEYLPDIRDDLQEFRSNSVVVSVLNLPISSSEFANIMEINMKLLYSVFQIMKVENFLETEPQILQPREIYF